MTESPTVAAALAPVDAVVFELDGVVLDTAELRAAAWKRLFDDVFRDPRLLTGPAGTRSDADYTLYLKAGRTREDASARSCGSRAVTSRRFAPGWLRASGRPSASRHARTNCSKNCSATTPPGPSPEPWTCLGRLRAGRVPVVLATSSPNAGPLLATAGLEGVFDHVTDGQTARGRASPASRPPRCPWKRCDGSTSRPPGPWSSRMPSPGWRPAAAAASAWSSGSTGTGRRDLTGRPRAPTSWSKTSANSTSASPSRPLDAGLRGLRPGPRRATGRR